MSVSLHFPDQKMELFSRGLQERGAEYRVGESEALFRLPDMTTAYVVKTDSYRILSCNLTNVDREELVRFAEFLITLYRGGAGASSSSSVQAPSEVEAWKSLCKRLPPMGGRGIRNPDRRCFMTATLTALTACPLFCSQVRAFSQVSQTHIVATRLTELIEALSKREQEPLKYTDAVLEDFSFSLVSAGCQLPIIDPDRMQDASELLQFIVAQCGAQFRVFDSSIGNAAVTSLLTPTLPKTKPDGDEWISLEECINQYTLLQEAPVMLPVWLSRSFFQRAEVDQQRKSGHLEWLTNLFFGKSSGNFKISRACRPPLVSVLSFRQEEAIKRISYYLRAIILHRGGDAGSGHYQTIVPLVFEGDTGGSNWYPRYWEMRDDSRVKVEELDKHFFDTILKCGVCFLYERED